MVSSRVPRPLSFEEYLLIDEAHSLGTYGATGLGCAEAQGVLAEADFIVGTFSKSLGGVGGVCVSDHPELRALHFLAAGKTEII